MEILDTKETAKVFKYLSSIFVALNKGSELIISDDEILLDRSPFYILSAKIKEEENALTKWGKEKTFTFQNEDFKKIAKCLKRNIVSISFDDSKFQFTIKTDDEEEEVVELLAIENYKNEDFEKKRKIEKLLTNHFNIPMEEFEKEIFEVFLNENKINFEKVGTKIIEIPTKRILSLLKKAEKASIKFSEEENGFRYISITSEDENLIFSEIIAAV